MIIKEYLLSLRLGVFALKINGGTFYEWIDFQFSIFNFQFSIFNLRFTLSFSAYLSRTKDK